MATPERRSEPISVSEIIRRQPFFAEVTYTSKKTLPTEHTVTCLTYYTEEQFEEMKEKLAREGFRYIGRIQNSDSIRFVEQHLRSGREVVEAGFDTFIPDRLGFTDVFVREKQPLPFPLSPKEEEQRLRAKIVEYEKKIEEILAEKRVDIPARLARERYEQLAKFPGVDVGAVTEAGRAASASAGAYCEQRKYEDALQVAQEAEQEGLQLRSEFSSSTLQNALNHWGKEFGQAEEAEEEMDRKIWGTMTREG